MHIGVLETGELPPDLAAKHGAYPDMFEALLEGHGFRFTNYSVVNNQFPSSAKDHDGWIITGSRHGAYEDHAWIPPLEALIRDIVGTEIPLVGICFGHQIMAQALGGEVKWFDGKWGIGVQEYQRMDGTRIDLLAIHQDQVVTKPPNASIIMHSEFCQNAGLSYNGKAISFQPHPEFKPALLRDLLELRRGTAIPPEQADPALDSLDNPHQSDKIALEIASFLKTRATDKAA